MMRIYDRGAESFNIAVRGGPWKTVKKEASATMNFGRLFGVAGDEKALHVMHMEYKTQKTSLFA